MLLPNESLIIVAVVVVVVVVVVYFVINSVWKLLDIPSCVCVCVCVCVHGWMQCELYSSYSSYFVMLLQLL